MWIPRDHAQKKKVAVIWLLFRKLLLTSQTELSVMNMTQLLYSCHLLGLTIGLITFLIIGLFHPLVIKGEYHLGVKCWWMFLVAALISGVASFLVSDVLLSTVLGVVSFSSFWSIKEIFEQRERVRKGWFPKNPRRKE